MNEKKKPYRRALAGAFLFASVLYLPWWVALAAGVTFAFMFKWYYEAVVAGFLMDSLYGTPMGQAGIGGFSGLIAGTAAVALSLYARATLRYYQK